MTMISHVMLGENTGRACVGFFVAAIFATDHFDDVDLLGFLHVEMVPNEGLFFSRKHFLRHNFFYFCLKRTSQNYFLKFQIFTHNEFSSLKNSLKKLFSITKE